MARMGLLYNGSMSTPVAPIASAPTPARLRITEVFVSLQGEARQAGRATLFIRLTGCPLRCHYCDTAYAFQGGQWRDVEDLVAEAVEAGVGLVTVTGGEPLAQRDCLELLRQLCDAGMDVSLETSGALDIGDVDPRVARVVDVKTPSSGENHRNRVENFRLLTERDQLKFVLGDRADYDWACRTIDTHGLAARCEILFSPVHGALEPRPLADWIVQDRLPVRLQIQLHKFLWGDAPGR